MPRLPTTTALIVVSLASLYLPNGSTESVRFCASIGGISLLAGNVLAYCVLCKFISWSIFRKAYRMCAARTILGLGRWLWRTRGCCQGQRVAAKRRIARASQARNLRGRRHLKCRLRRQQARGKSKEPWGQERHDRVRQNGGARPSLNTDILPPTENDESLARHVCLLFAVNPAIFYLCWAEVWEPLLLLCVFQHVSDA